MTFSFKLLLDLTRLTKLVEIVQNALLLQQIFTERFFSEVEVVVVFRLFYLFKVAYKIKKTHTCLITVIKKQKRVFDKVYRGLTNLGLERFWMTSSKNRGIEFMFICSLHPYCMLCKLKSPCN